MGPFVRYLKTTSKLEEGAISLPPPPTNVFNFKPLRVRLTDLAFLLLGSEILRVASLSLV